MPLKTNAPPFGKKPAAAAPRSVASSRKRPSAKLGASRKNNASPSSSKSALKTARHRGAFATLKSRQQAVERAKLQIWRHLPDINAAIIRLAESGSYLAARALFDFAGVYTVPPLEENTPVASLPTAPPAAEVAPAESLEKTAPPVNRIEAFLQTLGLDPLSDEEPEPDVAA